MLQDNTPHRRQVARGVPVVGGEGDRVEPELAGRPLALGVDVGRLVQSKL